MLTPRPIRRPSVFSRLRAQANQTGAALLEALIAALLLMIGVLALVELEGYMLSASTEAQMRGEATFLADQLIGHMAVDQGNLSTYVTTSGSCGNAYCTEWLAKVADTLPSGSATVTVDGNLVQVQIEWVEANSPPRQHQTSAAINF